MGRCCCYTRVFPYFNLEDKVYFDEGRNVTDLTTKEMHKEEEAESGRAANGNTGRVRRRPTWMKEYQM